MKIISMQQFQPEIKGVHEYINTYHRSRYEYNKKSYTHRLMCIAGGSCSFHYENRHFRCDVGDIVYFPPNQMYGTDFSEEDFRVFNIYFDFFPYREDSEIYSTTCAEGSHLSEFMGETVHFSDCEFFNTLQHIVSFPDALERISDIYREYSERRLFYKQKASALLTDLLIALYRFREEGSEVHNGNTIGDILAYINQNCRLPLRGKMLSERFNYHPNYINRMVQKATSMSLHTYILDTKIRQAAVMLLETDMSMTEIALWFSFYDSSHFSSVFRKIKGCSPCEYRNNNRIGSCNTT